MSNNNSNPQAGQGRPLPKKEGDLFRNVVKHYESKQYKKAIKSADTILKKFPNHGETLAMKGLTLNCIQKKDEAHALVKQGLMNDMRSHVCWHVYGLLHRADHNYNEAIKAYKQALKIDKDNMQILRDLSWLQMQMRDLNGFLVTRNTLLNLKPNLKLNWLAFCLSKHLTGDLEGAVRVIDIYLDTLDANSPEKQRDYEPSELALYKNQLLGELSPQRGYQHLLACKPLVVDLGAWMLQKAKYELQMGQWTEAESSYMQLMERGVTEDYRIHTGYMCAILGRNEVPRTVGTHTLATTLVLEEEQRQKLMDIYQNKLSQKFTRSKAVKQVAMTLMKAEELIKSLDTYCRKQLTKGVPSLASDLHSFFLLESTDKTFVLATDPLDVKTHPTFQALVQIADRFVANLESYNKYDASDEEEEPPSTILWAWYFRAGLHELAGEFGEGIALLEKCLEHTPTAVDVYELIARLHRSAGDIQKAVDYLDKGRDLDKQDRYINNLTTKYMLAADQPEMALERISLFTKHEGNPEQNLFDMQCCWYELDLADCLSRKRAFGKALKKYSAVVKHFEDFHEDQFDFHSYCIRKVTLRAYTDVLRWEDELWGQPYYGRAAEGLINLYLQLHDDPGLVQSGDGAEPDYSKMTAAERKKAKAIARKKKKAAEKKAQELEQKQKAENNGKAPKKGPVDEDPDGKELLKSKVPLDEARNFSAILSKHCPGKVSAWMLQFDVAIRRKKTLMALQALFKAKTIDAENHGLFSRIVEFGLLSFEQENEIVLSVVKSELPSLLDGCSSVGDFVAAACGKAKSKPETSLPMRMAIAEALIKTEKGTSAAASELIVNGGIDGRGVTVANCNQALAVLKKIGAETSVWESIVKERFPLSTLFSSS